MKIAVIGSGISGLSSAYFLSKKYKVDLYEKEDHFGGHSFTYDIKEGDKIVPVNGTKDSREFHIVKELLDGSKVIQIFNETI